MLAALDERRPPHRLDVVHVANAADGEEAALAAEAQREHVSVELVQGRELV